MQESYFIKIVIYKKQQKKHCPTDKLHNNAKKL